MTQRYTCRINLTVLGPFLTAATGPDRYGVDKSAHRDHTGQLVIPASHLKGKLRSALEELEPFFEAANRPNLKMLFGTPSSQGSYEPLPATLHFSDLVSGSHGQNLTRTRVTINRVSQTARQNLLREVEDPFASGSTISFTGDVTFFAADRPDAERVAGMLRVGLQWLATVGAEKAVGFGRLRSAHVSPPAEISLTAAPMLQEASDSLHLRITALEPLLAGGIKSRRTNYIVSREELTGGLLKGALAAALNEAHGVSPITRLLDASCTADYPGFETLIKHFSAIRVTHAWPALAGNPRPVRLPLSSVEHNAALAGDVALSDARAPLLHGRFSPAYFGDAKHLEQYAGLAKPVELFVTRAEIDDVSQRAAEGQLFTYQFIAPYDKEQRPIEWVCNVDFANIADPTERETARQQFAAAVQLHLHRLGKLDRRIAPTVYSGHAVPAQISRPLVEKEGITLITLQSDAIVLSPSQVRELPLGKDLHEAYAAYWSEISDGALVMVDFFAHQGFQGGYLYHRRMGTVERNQYRPYYLTLAGSLFKLRAAKEQPARAHLARWLSSGLPLPRWALDEYGHERSLWESCPFVPENGYGEIAVNLAWHWDYRI